MPGLKEADAFQRLVYSGMPSVYPLVPNASKKQTPFSVWYQGIFYGCQHQLSLPQRSRRLSASGMPQHKEKSVPNNLGASKKQTPFSVWYSAMFALFTKALRPQRSRRLSASGMRRRCRRSWRPSWRLKEADAFQRLVFENASGVIDDAFNASKKQTPFSVWYATEPLIAWHGIEASKKQTPFSVRYAAHRASPSTR